LKIDRWLRNLPICNLQFAICNPPALTPGPSPASGRGETFCGPSPASGRGENRRGAVLVVVLVCFVLAAAIFLFLGRLALRERWTSESQYEGLQAQWLAEAGIERAAARLAGDPGYAGETWTLSAKEIADRDGGVVRIHVTDANKNAKARLVRVEADYPADPVHHCRWTKEITVDVK